MEDLEEAITSYTLSLYPPGHPGLSMFLSKLGSAIFTRYERSCGMEDLEETIRYHLYAPDQSDPSTTLPVRFLLANSRYCYSGWKEDLEEVIT